MRVVVTGALGYIGRAIVAALTRRDHHVVAFVHHEAGAERIRGEAAEVFALDLHRLEDLFERAYGADAIIHAAYEPATDGEVERGAIDALIEALKGTGNPLVFTSALALPPHIPVYPAQEERGPRGLPWHWRIANEYHALRGWDRGVAVSIVRPPLAYGGGGGGVLLRAMLRDARERSRVRYVGDGSARWATVHVDDLADAYAAIVETPIRSARVYVPASTEHLSLRDLATLVALAARGRAETEPWPLDAARAELGELADVATWDALPAPGAEIPAGWRPLRPDLRDTLPQDLIASGGRHT